MFLQKKNKKTWEQYSQHALTRSFHAIKKKLKLKLVGCKVVALHKINESFLVFKQRHGAFRCTLVPSAGECWYFHSLIDICSFKTLKLQLLISVFKQLEIDKMYA